MDADQSNRYHACFEFTIDYHGQNPLWGIVAMQKERDFVVVGCWSLDDYFCLLMIYGVRDGRRDDTCILTVVFLGTGLGINGMPLPHFYLEESERWWRNRLMFTTIFKRVLDIIRIKRTETKFALVNVEVIQTSRQ